MKPRFLLPALALLVLFMAACGPAPELRNPKKLKDTSLITNEPCSAPCWRGITPGETSWADAVAIIENDDTLANLQVQDAPEDSTNPAAKEATWDQKEGEACCRMFTQDGETVQVIIVETAPDVSLGDMIDTQGEPTYLVGAGGNADQAVMALVYPEKQLVTYAFVAGEDQGALSQSSEIIGMTYWTTEDMDLLLKTNSLQAWEGYQSYRTYLDSPFEVTPSVTLTPTPTS
jgi:hypothetical protein